MPSPLPSGARMTRRILLYTASYAVLASGVITLYLVGLLRLEAQQWLSFAEVVALVFALIFPGMAIAHRGIFGRIARCLDQRAAGIATEGELALGFAAISDFPRYWFVWGLLWWAFGGVAVALGLWWMHPELGPRPGLIVIAATLSVAFITDLYYFFSVKRMLRPIRLALAADIGCVDRRRALVRSVSLRTKLLLAMGSVILVTVLYAGFLSQARLRDSIRSQMHRIQASALEALLASSESSFAEASRQVALFGPSARLLLLDGAPLTVVSGPQEALSESLLHYIEVQGLASGDGSRLDTPLCFSWRRVAAGGPLLLLLDTPAELAAGASFGLLFTALLLFATGVAMGVAYLLARDIGEATATLESEAARIAGGDLSRGETFDSEDELGELARSFERMAASLRTTVERVKGAAHRMHRTGAEVAAARGRVAEATRAQRQGIAQAGRSIASVDEQVRGIALSADNLGAEVDHASSSLLELEATGSELSTTASALAATTAELASGAEQLSHSIALVEQSSQSLRGVADQTSSSMSRAAQQMSAADRVASELSGLSRQVVGLAEEGQGRVLRTIEGMRTIHGASDSAREAMGELVTRSNEIEGVVGVIESVADETGLLALNAAIIAAQAGEQGRGFGVVASQVRALAARVAVSTQDIAQLIRALKDQGDEASGAIALGVRSVDDGARLAESAGDALDEITRASRSSGERIAEIVASMHEQSQAVAAVAALMEQLWLRTGEIGHALEEQSQSTALLRGNSHAMGDVSKQLERATNEQAKGTTAIRESVDGVRQSAEQIHAALQQQAEACNRVGELLSSLGSGADSNEESVAHFDAATGDLQSEAEALLREVAHFRT